MDRLANAGSQKSKPLYSNLFFAPGLAQTNKQAEEKMKNENEVTGLLIFVTQFKIRRLVLSEQK